jgi:hypothetical protein
MSISVGTKPFLEQRCKWFAYEATINSKPVNNQVIVYDDPDASLEHTMLGLDAHLRKHWNATDITIRLSE